MMIENFKQLAISPFRKDAVSIINAAYEAIAIENLIKKRFFLSSQKLIIKNSVQNCSFDLRKVGNIYLIGIGKGSFLAIKTISKILSPLKSRFLEAIALDKKDYHFQMLRKEKTSAVSKLKLFIGTHPRPSFKNVSATRYILRVLKKLKEDDLVIFFISGGGSSLLCGSKEELKLSSFVFDELTKKGASIYEINTVRKHLSLVKGGWLTYYSYPAYSLSLIASDVCGNDFSTIASGPTFFDKTTKKDAEKIIKKYLKKSSLRHLIISSLKETPKDKKYFKKAKHLLFVCNEDAVEAMKEKAASLGYRAKIVSFSYDGEARKLFFSLLKKIPKKSAFLLGGETTVKITGQGKGGRNQEAVLSAICQAIERKVSFKNIVLASFASDGYDNTPVAGALADEETLKVVSQKGVNPFLFLKNNDSYNFFKKIGGHIVSRRLTFNVSDLVLVIKK